MHTRVQFNSITESSRILTCTLIQCKTDNIYHIFFCNRRIYVWRELWKSRTPQNYYVIDAWKQLPPYPSDSARSAQSNAVRCEIDNQNMNSVLALKIFESIHKMHLRCFGVNIHPCYQIRLFFVCSRGAPVLANDINLQIHGFLGNNSMCLRFNMTLTTRNVSFWAKTFIYKLPQGVRLARPRGRCKGDYILVILRLSPHLPNGYVLFWLYYDNASPLNEMKTLNVLNSKSIFSCICNRSL